MTDSLISAEDQRLLDFIALHEGSVEFQVLSGAQQRRAELLALDGILVFSGRYVVRAGLALDARLEGEAAFRAGEYSNPYPTGTRLRDFWFEGWEGERRRQQSAEEDVVDNELYAAT